jgi:hypothetical protein
MTQYKARVSFFSSTGRHFNQGEIVDTTTFFNLTAADQGNILVETVAGNPTAAIHPGIDAAEMSARATHESLLAKIEHGFELLGRKLFSELEAIKKAVLTFADRAPESLDSKPLGAPAPEDKPVTALTTEEPAAPSGGMDNPEDMPAAIPASEQPPTA